MLAAAGNISGWVGLLALVALLGLVFWLTCWLLLIVLRRQGQRGHSGRSQQPYEDLWKLSGARLIERMSRSGEPTDPEGFSSDGDHDS